MYSDAINNALYLQVSRHDQFERKNGGGFDAAEFEAHPDRYVSNFAKKFAPYASVIVNGIYWDGVHFIFFTRLSLQLFRLVFWFFLYNIDISFNFQRFCNVI